jgi:hypothetical protein
VGPAAKVIVYAIKVAGNCGRLRMLFMYSTCSLVRNEQDIINPKGSPREYVLSMLNMEVPLEYIHLL